MHRPRFLLPALLASVTLTASACSVAPEDASSSIESTTQASSDGSVIDLADSAQAAPFDDFGFPEAESCSADSAEPDNAPDDALVVDFGSRHHRTACASDDDWMVIDIVKERGIAIRAAFDADEGELRLGLAAPDGKIVAQSEPSSEGAVLEYEIDEQGEYLLLVRLVDDAGEASGLAYGIEINSLDGRDS